MARRGRKTRRTRRIFRKPIPDPPNIEMSDTETTTTSRTLKGVRQNAPLWKRKP